MRGTSKKTASAVLALAIAAGVSPAAAESWSHRDARKDVYYYDVDGSTSQAPRNKTADAVRAEFSHSKDALKGKVKLRNVVDKGYYSVRAHVRTADGGEYDLYISWKAGRSARSTLQSPTAEEYNVNCPKKSAGYSVKRDTIRFNIPTRCLDDPGWTRVGFQVTQTTHYEYLVGHSDDALHKGEKKKNAFVPALSPRLDRG